MSADIRTRALACLARRDYSRAELRRKLLGETADIDQLDSTLDALERDGFLSDARFAEHLVAQRAARFGARNCASPSLRAPAPSGKKSTVQRQKRPLNALDKCAFWRCAVLRPIPSIHFSKIICKTMKYELKFMNIRARKSCTRLASPCRTTKLRYGSMRPSRSRANWGGASVSSRPRFTRADAAKAAASKSPNPSIKCATTPAKSWECN